MSSDRGSSPSDGEIEIGVLFRGPGRARPEGHDVSVRHISAQDIAHNGPVVRAEIKARDRVAHAKRSRNLSRRQIDSSMKRGMPLTTSIAMSSS